MTLILIILGCTPTCEDVCDKLVACENEGTERMSSDECQESCRAQEELYALWTDQQKRDAFDAELSCLYASECGEVEQGVCYVGEVWGF